MEAPKLSSMRTVYYSWKHPWWQEFCKAETLKVSAFKISTENHAPRCNVMNFISCILQQTSSSCSFPKLWQTAGRPHLGAVGCESEREIRTGSTVDLIESPRVKTGALSRQSIPPELDPTSDFLKQIQHDKTTRWNKYGSF